MSLKSARPNLRPTPLYKLAAVTLSLTVCPLANAQTLTDKSAILASIEQSFNGKGQIEAFRANRDWHACSRLIAAFGPSTGQVSRYDFAVRSSASDTPASMVACVDGHPGDTLNLEYFPASVLEKTNKPGRLKVTVTAQ